MKSIFVTEKYKKSGLLKINNPDYIIEPYFLEILPGYENSERP